MRTHTLTIAGCPVEITWNMETAKRYGFRMAQIGGSPTGKELSSRKTITVAMFKILWGLLPPAEFAKHDSPESLFVATTEEEAPGVVATVTAIFEDWSESEEKKSTGSKSPSRSKSARQSPPRGWSLSLRLRSARSAAAANSP